MLIHRAKWVVADPWTVIENGWVLEDYGRILEIGQGREVSGHRILDHGADSALIPGLVNAHTHLELSALKGRAALTGNFLDWVRSVIMLRDQEGRQNLENAASEALSGLENIGTALVAEVSTLGITRKLFEKSKIFGIWFKEYLGSGPLACPEITTHGLKRYFTAGHGPHTTTPFLLGGLKKNATGADALFTLHLAESVLEDEFIRNGTGEWAGFLDERGLDISSWKPCGKSPVAHCAELGILDGNTLAVHLVFADKNDLEIIAGKGVFVCICPRSNMALHKRLPDIDTMLALGIRPCLGTDSLACVDSLDIMDEMAYIFRHFAGINPADIFAMATINGAAAMGFSKCFGRIAKGSPAVMRVVPVLAKKPGSVVEEIVAAGGTL
ncbi:MAG: amidohydrolase family protein [Deltaproteobacteria bacterium]|nr:amidohydrolase family protein [Deltaproteobacteria bacterium]